ncbi:hypothetical protein [Aeromonas taiwanensis]
MSYVIEVLTANKERFTARQYRTLMQIAEHGRYEYRKSFESLDSALPYLPSFVQGVSDKLAAIGLEIESIPANDGSRRRLYSIRLIRRDHAEAIRTVCNSFGFGIYGGGDD